MSAPLMMDQQQAYPSLITALCERNAYTRVHCDRVCILATALGNALRLRPRDLEALRIASQLHDISKIGIRDEVLLKPGRLTPEEWEEVKTHSIRGERIVNETFLTNRTDVAAIVRHHHESRDGSGYPDGLSGDEIPQSCRILSIVDKYDAMTSVRVYRNPMSHGEAMAVLHEESISKIDPMIFSAFAIVMSRNDLRTMRPQPSHRRAAARIAPVQYSAD